MKNRTALFSIKVPHLQYLWALVLLDMTFQLFNFIPIFDRHYLFWGIGVCMVLLYSKSFFNSKSCIWLFIYLFIVYLNFLSGDPFFNSISKIVTVEALNFIFPAALSFYLFKHSDYQLYSVVFSLFALFLIESTIVSTWANYLYPGIIRLQSSSESVMINEAILKPFMRLGMTDYSLPHAIPVLIPGIVYAFLNSKSWLKLFFIFILLSSVVLAYVSGSFTAFVVSIMSLIMSFLLWGKNQKAIRIRFVIVTALLLPIILSSDLQLTSIRSLKSVFSEESISYKKLTDIEDSIEYGDAEGGVYNRKEKYDMTMNAILDSPLLGTNNPTVGGHSAIPDRMALLGLVGIIPYLFFLYYQVVFLMGFLKGRNRSFFFVGLGSALLILITKGTSAFSIWIVLLTLLPGLLWWIEQEKRI